MLEEAPSAEQADRVRPLFHRQLAVPLADGAETLSAYKAWEQAQQGGEGKEFKVRWLPLVQLWALHKDGRLGMKSY